jgi:hypothetical protein
LCTWWLRCFDVVDSSVVVVVVDDDDGGDGEEEPAVLSVVVGGEIELVAPLGVVDGGVGEDMLRHMSSSSSTTTTTNTLDGIRSPTLPNREVLDQHRHTQQRTQQQQQRNNAQHNTTLRKETLA